MPEVFTRDRLPRSKKRPHRWIGPIVCWLVMAVPLWSSGNGDNGRCVAEQRSETEQHRIDVIAKAASAAVCIFAPGGQGGGSGVVISPDGFVLTNYHVVESNGPFMKCSMPDGQLYDAVIVGIDPTGDVSLIQLLGRDDFPFVPMGDSDQVRAGDDCFAVGNPFLLATDFQPSISWGIVSGVHRYQYPSGTFLEYADCIQTDAAINPGNSGGPLFNARGELIGINGRGSFEKRGRVNVGVGYAISINQIKYFLSHLKSGRIVDHATLGATVATDDQGRVLVSDILESSDAYRRGLRIDDELIKFAGRDIQTVNQFKNILGIFPQGWRVPLVFRREGVEKTITVRLAGVHDREELIEKVQGPLRAKTPPPQKKETPPNKPNKSPHGKSPPGKKDLVPQEFRSHYIAQRGFANAYYNQLAKRRIWNQLLKRGDFSKQPGAWRLHGTLGDQSVVLVLQDEKSGIQIGQASYVLDPDKGLGEQQGPGDSGHLLATLHLWRKLLVHGPDQFGEVTYFGNIGDGKSENAQEAWVASTSDVRCYFLFDPNHHLLSRIEMIPELDSDPFTILFSDYRIDRDLTVPGKIKLSVPGKPDRILRISKIEFLEAAP